MPDNPILTIYRQTQALPEAQWEQAFLEHPDVRAAYYRAVRQEKSWLHDWRPVSTPGPGGKGTFSFLNWHCAKPGCSAHYHFSTVPAKGTHIPARLDRLHRKPCPIADRLPDLLTAVEEMRKAWAKVSGVKLKMRRTVNICRRVGGRTKRTKSHVFEIAELWWLSIYADPLARLAIFLAALTEEA